MTDTPLTSTSYFEGIIHTLLADIHTVLNSKGTSVVELESRINILAEVIRAFAMWQATGR